MDLPFLETVAVASWTAAAVVDIDAFVDVVDVVDAVDVVAVVAVVVVVVLQSRELRPNFSTYLEETAACFHFHFYYGSLHPHPRHCTSPCHLRPCWLVVVWWSGQPKAAAVLVA